MAVGKNQPPLPLRSTIYHAICSFWRALRASLNLLYVSSPKIDRAIYHILVFVQESVIIFRLTDGTSIWSLVTVIVLRL